MSEKVGFRGGPLSGMTMEGQFARKAVDVEHSPTRYPSRLMVEYDTIPAAEAKMNVPEAAYTEGRDKLLACYEFDEVSGVFDFSGWSVSEKLDDVR